MSTPAFERFCAGEDRLAAVLRTLPAFEPPAHMAEVFAAHVRSLAPAAAVPDTMFFEPPASLATAVAAEAARLHAAQAPRRAAALQQIAAGAPSAEVLGAAVGADSERWLTAQAALATRAAQVAEQKAAANTVRQSWWRRLQLVAASAAIAAVITTIATQFILQPDNADIAVAQFSPAAPMLPSQSAPQRLAANELASADAPAAQDRAGASPDRRRDAAAPAKPAAPADAGVGFAADVAATVRRRETQADAAREEAALGQSAGEQKKRALADAPKRQESAADTSARTRPSATQDMADQPPPPQVEAASAVAEAAPAQAAPAAAASASGLAKSAAPPPAIVAAPRMAATAPAAAKPAAPPAPAPQRSSSAAPQVFSFSDTPASVLQKIGGWQSQHRLSVRDPADPATQAWIEALRMAIPDNARPGALPVIGDTGVPDPQQVLVISAPEAPVTP